MEGRAVPAQTCEAGEELTWRTLDRQKLFGYVEDAEYALRSFKSIRCPEDVSFSGITDLEERINILAQRWPEALAELKAQLAGSQDQSVSPEVEPATVQG